MYLCIQDFSNGWRGKRNRRRSYKRWSPISRIDFSNNKIRLKGSVRYLPTSTTTRFNQNKPYNNNNSSNNNNKNLSRLYWKGRKTSQETRRVLY
eukprot:scaffold34685_cov183-Amphora_coffeaeformis.AAC.35